MDQEYLETLEVENENLRKELEIAYRHLEETWSDSRTAGLLPNKHFHIVDDPAMKQKCRSKKWTSLRAARNYIQGLYEEGKTVYIDMIVDEQGKECLYQSALFQDDCGIVNTYYLIKIFVSDQ